MMTVEYTVEIHDHKGDLVQKVGVSSRPVAVTTCNAMKVAYEGRRMIVKAYRTKIDRRSI